MFLLRKFELLGKSISGTYNGNKLDKKYFFYFL